jgi:hypothetical protein
MINIVLEQYHREMPASHIHALPLETQVLFAANVANWLTSAALVPLRKVQTSGQIHPPLQNSRLSIQFLGSLFQLK